ncbi:MAG: MerR family transcriptional regulator [Gammaproteobacteria bacterium]|nr:MerR family transcriptional regulator [Gammaproteobacteria bacterium]NND48345.1 MerR family transcriptional regulator [Woeseiaceae bacterium]
MVKKANKEEHSYGIGAVAKVTGLTDHTIRVWERRYGAVVARRAPNGRRVYSDADVEKLGVLKRLTDAGFSIGQIASSSVDQLRDQCQSLSDISSASLPEQIDIAVLGDYLPAQLLAHDRDIAPINVRVAESNRDRFAADLRCQTADVVILESPILGPDQSAQLLNYMKECGAKRGVIIYGFGSSRDVERARKSNIVVLRAPVDIEEVHAAVVRAYTQPLDGKLQPKKPEVAESPGWSFAGASTTRVFNQQQIARLANTSSTIECECPKHLAQLVGDLSAFEMYSANCANRDDDDAALHRYLHQTTAQARALVEVALKKVADAEGLTY